MGANDGILSTASIAIGVATASDNRETIILATLAGLIAGALSMAAGEYVSVSSQTDIEQADIEREKKELAEMPEVELKLLAAIYEKRGLKKETAKTVAEELTEHDALAADVRDELGLNEVSKINPIQAAISSCLAFVCGAALPLAVVLFFPLSQLVYSLYVSTLFFLILLGIVAAKTGGSSILKAIARISFWGTIAMGLTAWVGHLFKITI